ncbi:MAG: ATP synthase delta/epsilon chain alpha-helix domain-containing protein [Oscillospiraceae bacterium]
MSGREDIDTARAQASYERAQKVLHSKNASQVELKLAEARLKRALVRRGVAAGQ